MHKRHFLLAVALLSGMAQLAQAQTSSPVDLLKSMAGEWRVAYEMAPGPSGGGGAGEGEMTSWLGPGEASLILDYRSTSGPTRGFAIHQMIAWNASEKRFDIVWIDSFNPGVTKAEGKLEGGDIVYQRESVRGEHKVVSKGVISVAGPDSYSITSFMSLDGGPERKTMTLRYVRKP